MNFLFTTVFFLGISFFGFNQEYQNIAFIKSKNEFIESKQNGDFNFIMPNATSSSSIEQNSKYYTIYFTVKFDEINHQVTISMITNDEKSRHIICRFLASSGIEKINLDGKNHLLEEFYQLYLK